MVDSTTLKCPVLAILTTSHLHLVAFEPATYHVNGKGDRRFDNLSVPLARTATSGGFQGCKLVQPWFGPNYWQGILVPAVASDFEPKFEFKLALSFAEGGAIEFAHKFQEQVQRVLTAADLGIDEVLPAYSS